MLELLIYYFILQISYYMTSHKEPAILFYFINKSRKNWAPNIISLKLYEVFNKLINEDDSFISKEFHRNIDEYKFDLFYDLDTSPNDTLAVAIIRDFLYGNDVTDVSVITFI